jgi:hypothetical protein
MHTVTNFWHSGRRDGLHDPGFQFRRGKKRISFPKVLTGARATRLKRPRRKIDLMPM